MFWMGASFSLFVILFDLYKWKEIQVCKMNAVYFNFSEFCVSILRCVPNLVTWQVF